MTTEAIETTATDTEDQGGLPSAELLPIPAPRGGLVRPAADLTDVVQAMSDYQALCRALIDPADITHIGGRDFRNKSAWRKLAVAYGVSVELADRDYERDAQGRIVRAEIISRACAPNGRVMDGLGACDATERCDYKCGADCDGFKHFSKPGHDIPATAHTRATNRACADLFGMGEVSAEEVDRRETGDRPPPPAAPTLAASPVEGFPDALSCLAAHAMVAEAIAALPDGADIAALSAYKAEAGWPMPRARLLGLISEMHLVWAKAADQAPSQAQEGPSGGGGGPEVPGEGPQAEGGPDAPASGETSQTPDPDEGEACALCGEDVPPDVEHPPEGRRAEVALDGKLYHAECAPTDDETEADPGRPFTEGA